MQAGVTGLDEQIAGLAADGFAGAVRVDVAGNTELRAAYGLADRARAIPMTVDTRLGIASGSKVLTALAVFSLVEDGTLALSTTARSLLGEDLPLIAADVTVEHLLCHRSGIGDYLDEDTDLDRVRLPDAGVGPRAGDDRGVRAGARRLPHQVQGRGVRSPTATRGMSCWRCSPSVPSGVAFHDLVHQRVCSPAGMHATAFLRSDALPGDAALGYVLVDGQWLSNVFHLPVRGTGDGGAFTTVDDVHRLWSALLGGQIVSEATVSEMLRPRSDRARKGRATASGCGWIPTVARCSCSAADAGASFASRHDPERRITYTVIANTADGAWPVTGDLVAHLDHR